MNNLLRYSYKEHFAELKKRVLYTLVFFVIAFGLSYLFKDKIGAMLITPLLKKFTSTKIIYTAVTEAFVAYLELSMFAALLLTMPFVSYQAYAFVSPGLYKNEILICRILFSLAPLLFLTATIFVYFLVIPAAWEFFLSFNHIGDVPITFEPKISQYLSFIIKLMTAFGLAFELPVILIVLFLLKIVTLQSMIKWRRLAVVANFIMAAILTPPDVLSQFMLAIPMCILYEFAILICKKINQ
jgi:sec-independent protein translocase protein TatC